MDNTREVEEVIDSFDFEDELVDYGLERGMARKFASLIKGTFRTALHQQLQKAREEVYKEVQANAEQCYRDNGRGGFEPVKAVPLYKLFTN